MVCAADNDNLGKADRILFDFEKRKIKALLLSKEVFFNQPKVLLLADVKTISAESIFVTNSDCLRSLSDLADLKTIVKKKCFLEGTPVETESGKKLGTVADFSIDDFGYWLVKLFVLPSVWLGFLKENLIIDRGQIVKLAPEKIVVKDAAVPMIDELASKQKNEAPEMAPSS